MVTRSRRKGKNIRITRIARDVRRRQQRQRLARRGGRTGRRTRHTKISRTTYHRLRLATTRLRSAMNPRGRVRCGGVNYTMGGTCLPRRNLL